MRSRHIVSLVLGAVMALGCETAVLASDTVPEVDKDTRAVIASLIENELDNGGPVNFRGYDIDTASEVYGFDLEQYIETGSLKDSLDSEKPVYIVSFDNGTNKGEVYLSYDESDTLKISDSFVYDESRPGSGAKYNFDHKAVNATVSAKENVSDVILYQDGWNGLDLVSFKSDDTEYLIPYFTSSDEALNKLNGNIYTSEEFYKLIRDNAVPEIGDKSGGTVISDNKKDVPNENVKNISDTSNKSSDIIEFAVVPAMLLLSAVILTFITLRKKN